MYENIDMERTGILMKEMFDKSGYTVRFLYKGIIINHNKNRASLH